MGKLLIVAEKPSVGRDIANVLNCKENGKGCRIGENDIVTWAVGHLVGLRYPDEMDEKYTEWKLEDLPIFPEPFQLKVLESGEQQFEIVKDLMNDPGIDSIVCATDAGREGELIFRYIYQVAGCKKPVERLWISSLTYRAIKEGFENLKPESDYDNLYESARCRSEADWLIGMNASRAYAVENNMHRLSIGRVLSPTLSILVRRELERRQFVPEEYCEVVAGFGDYDGRLINISAEDTENWSRFPVEQKTELEDFIKNQSGSGTIVAAEYEDEVIPPQQLYDLTSLQRDANRLFGMSSKQTLDAAQRLYERYKAITYPRTDSRYMSSDIKSTLQKRLESLLDGELGNYAQQALASDRDLFGRFINNQSVSDHHAIIPTGEAKGIETWTKPERRIFDLVARRFIGMFFPDRVVIHQKIKTMVDGRRFLSIGEKEVQAGWKAVDKSRNSQLQVIPDLNVRDSVTVTRMRLRTDQTKAPAPHTEASLLAAMEHAGKVVPENSTDDTETEYGIGTPATRAATIEKLIEKEMVVRKGRTLIPTEYGIKLTGILPEVLQSPEMTGEWEARLSRISQGNEEPDKFMRDVKSLTQDIIDYAVMQGDKGLKNANSVGQCPLCGNPVKEYNNAYYCINKQCAFRKIYKIEKGRPTLHSIIMRELIANGSAVLEKGTYTLTKEKPYIAFERSPMQKPDYTALAALIEDYGLETVDKVQNGGALWLAGSKNEELLNDFVRDARKYGCNFDFVEDSRALKHKSGWFHTVAPEFRDDYVAVFVQKSEGSAPIEPARTINQEKQNDPVVTLIEKAGFEYADKRDAGGSLWIIAGEEEGKQLVEQCKKFGTIFIFTEKGGRASKKRPAWYSVK